MKVLIVSPWYKPEIGGVVETTTNLISGLQSRGVDVSILIHGDSLAVRHVCMDGKTNVYSCRLRSPQSDERHARVFFAWLILFLPTLLALRRFIKRENIDIVNIHFPMSGHFYFAWLRRLTRLKVVVSVHGSDMRILYATHWLNRLTMRNLLLRADALVACSNNLLQYTLTTIGKSRRGRSEFIYGGVGNDWLPGDGRGAADMSEEYILAVGSLRPVKGLDILIRAFGAFAASERGHRLHIVGDGPDRAELAALATELGLEQSVCFIGAIPHEQLRPIYARSLFCVIPSRSEALSLVALEAQAMGKAVIASAIGGLPEIVEDGVNGLLFPMGDDRALCEAMKRLVHDRPLRQQMGSLGQTRITSKFTWNNCCRSYYDIFAELTGAGDGRKSLS